jgi:hypothetical protein
MSAITGQDKDTLDSENSENSDNVTNKKTVPRKRQTERQLPGQLEE